jgi:hypothetical protein
MLVIPKLKMTGIDWQQVSKYFQLLKAQSHSHPTYAAIMSDKVHSTAIFVDN